MVRQKKSSNPPASSPPPFRFEQPQGRIDWTALDRLDVHRLVKDADLDTLEQILPSVAHGNLKKYSFAEITPHSLRRLFEVSQLAVQYLLYVQDRLAADVKGVKGQLEDALAEVGTLQASMAELRKDADATEREARHSRRMLRIALAQSQVSETSTASQISQTVPSVEQQVSAPLPAPTAPATGTATSPRDVPVDPEAAERLRRLEDGIKELLQWKQLTSASFQPSTSKGQHWNGIENAEAVDISPRAAVPAPPPPTTKTSNAAPQNLERSAYQAVQDSLKNTSFQTPLERQPSNNLATAAAINSSAAATATPLTNIHTLTSSNTPPRSPTAPTSPSKHQGFQANPVTPSSPAIRRQFLRELPHEAVGHERPGVISRFPHPLGDLRSVKQELQSELESELVSELAAQGIHDPEGCRGLTPAEYLSCMEALQQRRAAAASQMNEQDKAREQDMRKTVTWHVDSVTKSVAAATKTTAAAATTQSPPPLPLPPQTRPTLRPTTLRVKTTVTPPAVSTTSSLTNNPSKEPSPVDLAMLEVKDQETDAFYSPLRRGHSVNDGGLGVPGTPGTPSRQHHEQQQSLLG